MASGRVGSQKSYFNFPQPIVVGPPVIGYPNAATYINAVQNKAFVSSWLGSVGVANTGYSALIIGIDGEIWGTLSPVPASGLPTSVYKTWFTKIYAGSTRSSLAGSAVSSGNMPGVIP